MQTCDPRLITRPDVFAYGRAIPEVAGWYDYRICYRQSATERLRTLQALSWSVSYTHLTLPTTPYV